MLEKILKRQILMHFKYLIIGAGPTGLGAAYRLKELGENNFHLIEAQDYAGGLATTFKDKEGFLWDIGGHVQFSHYPYFDALMERALQKEGWLNHQRESWVWMKGRFVPYPFQNNIRYLPKNDMWECLRGIIEKGKLNATGGLENFEDWIYQSFGKGIAELFMCPYNYKVWAYPPEQLSYNWIGERVASVDLERISENILFERDDLSWGPNNTFQFPSKGGTGQIWKNIAALIGRSFFSFQERVCEIHATQKKVRTQNGKEFSYDYLLSTMPVDKMTALTKGIAPGIVSKASRLKHSSSCIVGVGLKGKPKEELAKKCWMYFPESDCPFYRVTVFSNYSPNNVPDPEIHWSLMTETSESPQKEVNRETLIEETIQGLLNTRLIQDRSEVVSTWQYVADYGYPTPSVERNEIIQEVLPALAAHEIYSRGRFGAWKYEVSNQDHSTMQGVEWVNRMVLGTPELTVNFPSLVNTQLSMVV
jgi:protoporphyrinogen oxidase